MGYSKGGGAREENMNREVKGDTMKWRGGHGMGKINEAVKVLNCMTLELLLN